MFRISWSLFRKIRDTQACKEFCVKTFSLRMKKAILPHPPGIASFPCNCEAFYLF